jgi:hypothetical protein
MVRQPCLEGNTEAAISWIPTHGDGLNFQDVAMYFSTTAQSFHVSSTCSLVTSAGSQPSCADGYKFVLLYAVVLRMIIDMPLEI